jgi:hypothetical protein
MNNVESTRPLDADVTQCNGKNTSYSLIVRLVDQLLQSTLKLSI